VETAGTTAARSAARDRALLIVVVVEEVEALDEPERAAISDQTCSDESGWSGSNRILFF
jgi:hypothetical protein